MTEQLYLFEDITPTPSSNEGYRQSSIFEDYDGFVEKFMPKKTTDDCYTPPAVYDVVRGWVMKQWPELEGATVVRPFYPGGDFEHFDYPVGCVVIDNPPFSIYSRIVRWYVAHGIRFFLFGPELTLPVAGLDVTYIVTDACIVYENGASVCTGFVTNLPSEMRIICGHWLKRDIENACKTTAPPKKNFHTRQTLSPLQD